ncbi:MAG: peptidase M14 [Planctomycetes bacterium]|nr:peptidase M14 [Planctomycetota bacterium]
MDLSIDCGFPGGNIIVDRIERDRVFLRQDLRDTEGPWFYWCFRVRNAPPRRFTFHFTDGDVLAALGPAVSLDSGRTWRWLGRETPGECCFTYDFTDAPADVRFSFAMPCLQSHFHDFAREYAGRPGFGLSTLCRSNGGRDVELVRLGAGESGRLKVLLTCRHHCCEMMASYALEGIISSVMADDGDGDWFRSNVDFLIVPFVDKDGVEQGDQGKNRRPRDHGRDYAGDSIYAETFALRSLVPRWLDGGPFAQMDLHCPHIRGEYNESVYLVGQSGDAAWGEQCAFGNILEEVQSGVLRYRAADNLPFGKAWNKGVNYALGKGCSTWASELPGVTLAGGIEIPYAVASGAEVNADTARLFGRDLALAFRRYLDR